jgi:thiol-disulfide isomerase/thioredoxin
MSTQLEYSGRVEAAKAFIRFAESKIDILPTENAKEELKQNSEKFWKRVNVLGSEIDFSELADVEGKAFNLDDYKGKVVIVDVWATWCNPCIEELPNLRNLYKDQQTKGLEIIGINVDEDSARLAAFLSSEKLPWKTYVSSNAEKREFETPAVSRLGISAIPFIAVIGKDGKVAAIHLRGRALEKKILEILAAQP